MDMHGRVYRDPKSKTRTIDSNNNEPNIGQTKKAPPIPHLPIPDGTDPSPATWDMKKILNEIRLTKSRVGTECSDRLDYEEKVDM